MIQHLPLDPASEPESSSTEHHASEPAAQAPESKTSAEDWNADPPRHQRRTARRDPAVSLPRFKPGEMAERHIGMLNALSELTFPLASEYLGIALEVSPDAPGHDRIVGKGCKLAVVTNTLVMSAEKLSKDLGS